MNVALIMLAFLLPSVILIGIGVWLKTRTTKKFNRCTAKTVGEVSGYDARGDGVYWPYVEYEVNGSVYKGKLIYRAIVQKKSLTYKGAVVTSDKFAQNLHIKRNSAFSRNPMEEIFPVGSPLDVYYNPDKPKENYVQRRPKTITGSIFIWTGIGIAIVGIVGTFLFL